MSPSRGRLERHRLPGAEDLARRPRARDFTDQKFRVAETSLDATGQYGLGVPDPRSTGPTSCSRTPPDEPQPRTHGGRVLARELVRLDRRRRGGVRPVHHGRKMYEVRHPRLRDATDCPDGAGGCGGDFDTELVSKSWPTSPPHNKSMASSTSGSCYTPFTTSRASGSTTGRACSRQGRRHEQVRPGQPPHGTGPIPATWSDVVLLAQNICRTLSGTLATEVGATVDPCTRTSSLTCWVSWTTTTTPTRKVLLWTAPTADRGTMMTAERSTGPADRSALHDPTDRRGPRWIAPHGP